MDILSTLPLIGQSIIIMLLTLSGERTIWPEFGGRLYRHPVRDVTDSAYSYEYR